MAKNELYVKDGDSYRLAKYADCSEGGGSFTQFFRRVVGYVYTGWQNIDGKSYYYTKDHEKVTGDQVIGGVQYHFNSDGSLDAGSGVLGIDVSKYQPSINWSSVKASGVDFVIIRCGYRGASTGALIEDPYFKSHIKGAKRAGLKVGVYFFSTALSEAEAVEEASMCAALCSGYGINYPIFMDCENSPRPGYNSMSASERTTIIKAFCNTIKSAGYTPGVYANKTWFSSYINTSALSGCKIWLAQYNSSGPTYSGHYDLWQYTSKGHVDGISGNVDMNQSYLGY
jgi:GH25 family lysozyme M1 (1,4-beta-N-acetylmuramidase)